MNDVLDRLQYGFSRSRVESKEELKSDEVRNDASMQSAGLEEEQKPSEMRNDVSNQSDESEEELSLDKLLYGSLRPIAEPDEELNRQILERKERNPMKSIQVKKIAAAAAAICAVAVGGVSVSAAVSGHSLLSLFEGESVEVQENAKRLLETEVKQAQAGNENKEQSEWASFEVAEAVCDRNLVYIKMIATPKDKDRYLLVSDSYLPEDNMHRHNLNLYTEEQEKTRVGVYARIGSEGFHSTSTTITEGPEGTLIFYMTFTNEQKNDKLNCVCDTYVLPGDGLPGFEGEILSNQIAFSLEDRSGSEEITYLPVDGGEMDGIDWAIDKAVMVKSDLEMLCSFYYRYTGDRESPSEKDKYDILTYILLQNENGETIVDRSHSSVDEPVSGGWGSMSISDSPTQKGMTLSLLTKYRTREIYLENVMDDGELVLVGDYSLGELSDTLTLEVRKELTGEVCGNIVMERSYQVN